MGLVARRQRSGKFEVSLVERVDAAITEDAMTQFKPNARQRKLIDEALSAHRSAQVSGRYAPDRLVSKWSSEIGIYQSTNRKAETRGTRNGGVVVATVKAASRFAARLVCCRARKRNTDER